MAAPGSHTFFHKPPVNPNLATLLHCTQISAINFPHCAVARLSGSQPSPPSFLRLLLVLVPHPPFRPPATLFINLLSLSSVTLPGDRGPVPSLTDTSRCFFTVAPRPTVRIVIGKQISIAVLKVSALMEPGIFSPMKIPRLGRSQSSHSANTEYREISAYARVIERHCAKQLFSEDRELR